MDADNISVITLGIISLEPGSKAGKPITLFFLCKVYITMTHTDKIDKEVLYIQEKLVMDQTFTNNSLSPIVVYASFEDLVNNHNQIVVPVQGIMTYKGPYNVQPAVYTFIHNRIQVLISQAILYDALRAQLKHM
jgi:hypothetical protein